MIRLKQSMGNLVKCKIDTEDMISKYECSILEDNRLNSLFSVQIEKSNVLVYSDDVKRKLSDLIEFGMNEEEVISYLCQMARVMADVKKIGLNPGKLVMHSDWIYLSRDNKTLKFIYSPVNGLCGVYDGILYMKDFLFASPLSKEVRDWWKQWLENVSQGGITEQALKKMESLSKEGRNASERNIWVGSKKVSVLDEDGEAMTGLEQEAWDSYEPTGIVLGNTKQVGEEEPLTGREESVGIWEERMPSFYEQNFYEKKEHRKIEKSDYFGEDGEAPTGVETYEVSEKQVKTETIHRPTLVRANTGERVAVSSDNFKLGRSEQRADFCIRNNSGISNVHATIMYKAGQYFLKDNYSTNGSYVNGNKILDSSIPVLLHDGSVIQLYNEEIVFHF